LLQESYKKIETLIIHSPSKTMQSKKQQPTKKVQPPSAKLPEGFLFVDGSPLENLKNFPLKKVIGPIETSITVPDENKVTMYKEKLFPENVELARSVMEKIQPHVAVTSFPVVQHVLFFDFHGVVNCPAPEDDNEITIAHFINLFKFLIQLRQKGIGVIILSFVGKLTASHANLLAYCSQKLFQDIFVGVISVFDKIYKDKKAQWGKGKVLSVLMEELKIQPKTVFYDDDPDNILDARLWLGNPDVCKLIQFADHQLTRKASESPKIENPIVAQNLTNLINEIQTVFSF
jgi:hypothetical protein